MLMEIYRDPNLPHADRISAIIDHVFERPPAPNSRERNRDILRLLLEKLEWHPQTQQQPDYGYASDASSEMSGSTYAMAVSNANEIHVPWQWQQSTHVEGGPVQYLPTGGYLSNWESVPEMSHQVSSI